MQTIIKLHFTVRSDQRFQLWCYWQIAFTFGHVHILTALDVTAWSAYYSEMLLDCWVGWVGRPLQLKTADVSGILKHRYSNSPEFNCTALPPNNARELILENYKEKKRKPYVTTQVNKSNEYLGKRTNNKYNIVILITLD